MSWCGLRITCSKLTCDYCSIFKFLASTLHLLTLHYEQAALRWSSCTPKFKNHYPRRSFNFLNSYPSLVLGYHNFHAQHTLTSLAYALHCLLCHLDVYSSQVYICRKMCHLFQISFKPCFLGNSFCIQALFSFFTVSSCHLPAPLIVLKKTIFCIISPWVCLLL